MDLTPTKESPQISTPTPARPRHSAEPFSFPNGTLKRHNPRPRSPPPIPAPLYRECLKNHAASLGGHALDGCGEFMPSPLASPADPTSLKCAACGCHRNFHRRDDDAVGDDAATGGGDLTPKRRSSSSASPPPLQPHTVAPPPIPSYFPSAPHMLLALSTGLGPGPAQSTAPVARKRFRTKFSREQKEKMFLFADKLGWRMQKQDEITVEEFCNEIGVAKGVLKVWMHNNKHTTLKKDQLQGIGSDINNDDSGIDNSKTNGTHVFNGSSSSS